MHQQDVGNPYARTHADEHPCPSSLAVRLKGWHSGGGGVGGRRNHLLIDLKQ